MGWTLATIGNMSRILEHRVKEHQDGLQEEMRESAIA